MVVVVVACVCACGWGNASQACYGIDKGEIVDTHACTGDWASKTFAAMSCCEKEGSAPGGRQGRAIPPAPARCSA